MKVQKKPTILEAEQWKPGAKIKDVQEQPYNHPNHGVTTSAWIMDGHRRMINLKEGDWILTEPSGVHYVASNQEIETLYDKVYAPAFISEEETLGGTPSIREAKVPKPKKPRLR